MSATIKHPETLTQAYHAGVIVAKVENSLPNESIPPIGVCLANFHTLRELFGERLWQKLKSRKRFVGNIAVYESLTYQPFLPIEMIGSGREFCLGFVKVYSPSKTRARQSKRILLAAPRILAHLEK